MEQIKDPENTCLRRHLVRTTKRKANALIGTIDKNDSGLRIIEMREV